MIMNNTPATETNDAGQEMPKSALATLLLRLDAMEARQDRVLAAVDALTGDVQALMDGVINAAEDLGARIDKVETLIADEAGLLGKQVGLALKDTAAIYQGLAEMRTRFSTFVGAMEKALPEKKDEANGAAPTADKLFG